MALSRAPANRDGDKGQKDVSRPPSSLADYSGDPDTAMASSPPPAADSDKTTEPQLSPAAP